jgi:cyanosortase A-associated protein
MNWEKLRVPLLVLTFANVLLVFGRSILDPTIGKRTVPYFVFPPVVPLPQWQQVASHPLKNQIVDRPPLFKVVLTGSEYRYLQNNLPLDIEMRYEVGTEGDVKRLIQDNTAIKFSINQPLLVLRQQQGIGFYGLYVYQQRAYLDACINSRGGSTFTKEQFRANRIHYDVQFNRLIPWLLGQQELRDQRCLLAHLSIPLNQSSPESSYHILETAWFSWYQWWLPRFPKL